MKFSRAKTRRSAFTLLELLVAMAVLYIASAYLMSLFTSGWRYSARNREYSATLFLARSEMERLACAPVELLGSVSRGSCASPYQQYTWEASVSEYSGELKLLTVVVTSPRRAKSKLLRLVRTRMFLGVSCDAFSDQVVWTGIESAQVKLHQYSATTPRRTLNLAISGLSPAYLGAVSSVPGRGFMWAAGSARPTIGYYAFDEQSRLMQRYSLTATPPVGYSPPLFTGIAGDSWGSRLYCADIVNGSIWVAEEGSKPNTLRWLNTCPWQPTQLPLQEPLGLALDENASILWIAESTARALRPLYLHSDVRPSGSCFEVTAAGVTWGERCQPTKGSGSLSGAAVNPWSSAVYTADSTHLHRLAYVPKTGGGFQKQWNSWPLPSALRQDLPSGLACSSYGDIVYINTRRGQLWQCQLRQGNVFSRVE